jgi:hypothetical protein
MTLRYAVIRPSMICTVSTECDLHRVDGVDAALPVEHEGELTADLDEIDAVRTPLATHSHHHLGNALTTMDELACRPRPCHRRR